MEYIFNKELFANAVNFVAHHFLGIISQEKRMLTNEEEIECIKHLKYINDTENLFNELTKEGREEFEKRHLNTAKANNQEDIEYEVEDVFLIAKSFLEPYPNLSPF